MIDRVLEFSIRNRWLVIAAGLALALAGVYAVYHTPVDAIPDLSENQVIVFTEWPGHSPPEIEDQITYPLSLELQGLAGVRVVRSSSDVGFSMINVIFEDAVPPAAAREQVAGRLARARPGLPPGVAPALGPDAAATGQIFWYTVEGPGLDPGRLRAVQDWFVRPQLSSVPGVAEVASVGGSPIEYTVEVDPRRLALYGVTAADVERAVSRANAAVGGHVVHKANAEYVVRGAGWIGQAPGLPSLPAGRPGSGGPGGEEFDPRQALRDLENVVLPRPGGGALRVADVATVALGPQPRRGVLEKDGSEVVGGVVLMRQGENPLEVTRRLKAKVHELQAGLPAGVRIVSFYDRTPLIKGAVGTVTGTLLEAIGTATLCVVLVLLHFRTSFVIALTLPLAVLASFTVMWLLRVLGVADVQTNVMSLAGLAISVGVLVDSSIVMAENVMHSLKERFGDAPVTGDVRPVVLAACRTVGRPIFFSVVIMLLSFLPVFALGGIEGKMFHPLAFTKSFALAAVAVLAVTLVPALCTIFIRGRLRGETDSWLVRGVVRAYRPVLDYSLRRPAALVWLVGVTFLVGLAPLGLPGVFLTCLLLFAAACARLTRTWATRGLAVAGLLLVALVADRYMQPLGREFMTPLDEGMTMDMPITVPRASVTQSADDLKARDMVFCRFPEVDMVVGKAGRAETPTDPAPLDMIETMVNFRPQELWPRRKLRPADAERHAEAVLTALAARGIIQAPEPSVRPTLIQEATAAAMPMFDAQMREYAYQRNLEFERSLGPELVRFGRWHVAALLYANGSLPRRLNEIDLARLREPAPPELPVYLARDLTPEDADRLARDTVEQLQRLGQLPPGGDPFRYRPSLLARLAGAPDRLFGATSPTFLGDLHSALESERLRLWRGHIDKLNGELPERAAALSTRLLLEELLSRATVLDARASVRLEEWRRVRTQAASAGASSAHHGHGHHHAAPPASTEPQIEPYPPLDDLQNELSRKLGRGLLLWPTDRADLTGFGGELDDAMQMPGWTNVWTMPIQNRVDMLSTGVNTAVGVRVLGRRLEDVVRASEDVAAVLKGVPGAADVVADPVRGKGYLTIRPDRDKAARLGVSVGDVNDLIDVALGGRVATTTVEGRERHPVRVRLPRDWRADEETLGDLPVPRVGAAPGEARSVPLSEVATVTVGEGPATIKSENGLLRNYVRLNVRGRDAGEFVAEARRIVADRVHLPPGVYLEWTGQFEHEERARGTLLWVVPLVLALIALVLYLTYRDAADAGLMLLTVPGALAGGVFFQWLFGAKFSVTVWVGYIACFGMATATGIIMLVYLREAVARRGGLERMSLDELRQAVLDGAVQRLRPKLLTEGTMVLGLAPLLWTSGVGAEVIRPMVIPVLGGILVADEVIDLFLPVLFYAVRRWRWHRLHGPPHEGPFLPAS
jgi:Cu(I)/Ag(I) efflux system membrane protein CusA/SilA